MARHLIVTQPFASYVVGERIEDAAKVAEIERGASAAHVVAVIAPDAPKTRARKDETTGEA